MKDDEKKVKSISNTLTWHINKFTFHLALFIIQKFVQIKLFSLHIHITSFYQYIRNIAYRNNTSFYFYHSLLAW